VRNNIFWVHAGTPYLSGSVGFDGSEGAWSSNLWNGGSGDLSLDSAAVTGDPQFANAADADFHLTAGSVAVDKGSSGGTVSTLIATDYDLNIRPQGQAIDIGALELATGTGNLAPVARNDSYSTAFDTVLVVAAPGVLGNDTDTDGDALGVSSWGAPAHGTLSAKGSGGGFSYTPASAYSGTDSFTYTVSDGKGGTATGSVTVTVGAIAGSAYSTQIQTMYIGYFGRPADPGGMSYYAALMEQRGGNNAAMLDDFWNSAESHGLYPQTALADKIAQIYEFLFGRPADSGGVTYWSGMVLAGKVTVPSVAYTVAYNAQAADTAILEKKRTAAQAFMAALDTTDKKARYQANLAPARAWLDAVVDDATLAAALASLTGVIAHL
jgi:hypothetical protein